MTVTPDELALRFKADALARLAGLDDNRDPVTYNRFAFEAEEALQEYYEKGRREAARERGER